MGKKIIKLLVHVPDSNSFGDPSALLKLYNILKHQYSDQLDIEMIFVVKKEDEAQLESLFTGGENYSTIDPSGIDPSETYPSGIKPSEFTKSKNERDKFYEILKDADLLIIFPTPHFLSPAMVNEINQHGKLLAISMMEYNGDLWFNFLNLESKSFPLPHGCHFWNTGIGEDHLGFIFEDISNNALQETDKINLGNLQRAYWFGYANIQLSILDCSTANPADFISFAALTDTEKDIQIFVRIHANENDDNFDIKPKSKLSYLKTREFAQTLDQYDCVCLHYHDSKTECYIIYNKDKPENVDIVNQHTRHEMVAREVKKEEFERFLKTADKSISIKNPFPVKRDTMIALMRGSQKVNLVTGDQSLSECLSLGKIPFYQTMVWKQLLYTQLVKAAGKYECHYLKKWFELLGNKLDNFFSNPIPANSIEESLLKLHSDLEIAPAPVKDIAKFYKKHQDKLSEDIIRFSKKLKASENMSKKTGPELLSFLKCDTKERFRMFVDSIIKNPVYFCDFLVRSNEDPNKLLMNPERLKPHLKFYLQYDTYATEQKIQQKEMLDYFVKFIKSERIQIYNQTDVFFMLDELRRELQLDKLDSFSFAKTIILKDLMHLSSCAEPNNPNFPPSLKVLLNCLEFIDYDKLETEDEKEAFINAISDWQCIRIDNNSDCDALSHLILNMVTNYSHDSDLIKAGLKLLFTTPYDKSDQSIFSKLRPEIRSQCIRDIAKTEHGMEYLIKILFVKSLTGQDNIFFPPTKKNLYSTILLNHLDKNDRSFLRTEVLKLKGKCNPEDTRLFEAIKEFEKAYNELPASSVSINRPSQI